MYSLGSLIIGVGVAGLWVATFLGVGLPFNLGGLGVLLASFLACIAGVVLAGAGLVLQQARRIALAGLLLNLVPAGILVGAWLLHL